MKDTLQEQIKALRDAEEERDKMWLEKDEAQSETEHFQEKYERLFNSVSGLNQRIEELEEHKKLLLDKVKGAGDVSGLEYLIKSQGLENVGNSSQSKSKIQVENYNPEAQ